MKVIYGPDWIDTIFERLKRDPKEVSRKIQNLWNRKVKKEER